MMITLSDSLFPVGDRVRELQSVGLEFFREYGEESRCMKFRLFDEREIHPLGEEPPLGPGEGTFLCWRGAGMRLGGPTGAAGRQGRRTGDGCFGQCCSPTSHALGRGRGRA